MIPFHPINQIGGEFLGRGESLEEISKHRIFTLVQVDQVHGEEIWVLRKKGDIPKVQGVKGDAMICTLPNVGLVIRTADCVPILMAHPSGLVAAVHAGWRGTHREILTKTLSKIRKDFQIDLKEIRMAVGPSICLDCYEVGKEVADQFSDIPSGQKALFQSGKFHLDLKRINVNQAKSSGVPECQIKIHNECTFCQPDDFHSHRKAITEGKLNLERNYSWVGNYFEVR
jgi:hypothetical protein